ncbi:hypothetical protein OHA74_54335 [Streptomyces phaeochromogenes]|uniref:hypothetical protein n=1 Tax=Streptomyces phaeochromogenes TaxID=1923 RepID=UPI002E2D2C49|nr:hypothetical protein [Streptomyces phaeochromogenes]
MSADFSALHEPLVEWVYDRTRADPLGGVPITEFGQLHGLTENQTYQLLQFCKGQRFLDDRHTTHDGPEANLTPRGLEWMEERRRRRADPAARAAAARTGLLVWLWHRKHDGILLPAVADVLNDPLSLFEGERLTTRDIDRASAYLSAKGLIKGDRNGSSDGPVHAEITAEGEDCVDNYQGDIGAYERRNTSGNTTIHIGQNTGNIAANSRDFTLNATRTAASTSPRSSWPPAHSARPCPPWGCPKTMPLRSPNWRRAWKRKPPALTPTQAASSGGVPRRWPSCRPSPVVRWAAFSPPTSESCCLDCRQRADASRRSTGYVGSPARADETHRGGIQPPCP